MTIFRYKKTPVYILKTEDSEEKEEDKQENNKRMMEEFVSKVENAIERSSSGLRHNQRHGYHQPQPKVIISNPHPKPMPNIMPLVLATVPLFLGFGAYIFTTNNLNTGE